VPDNGYEKPKHATCCMAFKYCALYFAYISPFMYNTVRYCWLCPYFIHTLHIYSISSYDSWGMWFSIWEKG
jgi:hypothetical protein